MKTNKDLYDREVLEDVRKYDGLSHGIKASWVERRLVQRVPLDRLHVNPEDEFADPAIGPNYEIVGRYRDQMVQDMKRYGRVMIEPIVVEKTSAHGYKILNGHHRWMAARMLQLKTVPIRIVNETHEEDIRNRMARSENTMCVSFDLDEVLLCNPDSESGSVNTLPEKLRQYYPKPIRFNTYALINRLAEKGFDMWVYTGEHYPVQYVRGLMWLYLIRRCNIIIGSAEETVGPRVKSHFNKKYDLIAHVDNDYVLITNTRTKEYETFGISSGSDWASNVYKVISRYLKKNQEISE